MIDSQRDNKINLHSAYLSLKKTPDIEYTIWDQRIDMIIRSGIYAYLIIGTGIIIYGVAKQLGVS